VKSAATIVAAWLVPGGGYLLARRYKQGTLFLALICAAVAAGVALHGGNLWPRAEDLQGLDGLTARIAQAGALAKGLAGGPYLIAASFGDVNTYTQGRIHEYGTTLLTMAGLLNVLAIVDARR
jgi:hypothetical protein